MQIKSKLGKILLTSGRFTLDGSDLSWANLRDADLRGVNLRGVNLFRSILSGADLRDSDLSGADLYDSDLSGANLENVTVDRYTRINSTTNLDPEQLTYLILKGVKYGN